MHTLLTEDGLYYRGSYTWRDRFFNFIRRSDGSYMIELDTGRSWVISPGFAGYDTAMEDELDFLALHFFPGKVEEFENVRLSFLLFGAF